MNTTKNRISIPLILAFILLIQGWMILGSVSTALASLVPSFSPGNSTLSAAPTSVAADGVSTSTVTATIYTTSDSVMSGTSCNVTLSSSRGATDTISPSGLNNTTTGIATFTVKSSTAGSATFTATVSTCGTGNITQTATVTFTAVVVAPLVSCSSLAATGYTISLSSERAAGNTSCLSTEVPFYSRMNGIPTSVCVSLSCGAQAKACRNISSTSFATDYYCAYCTSGPCP